MRSVRVRSVRVSARQVYTLLWEALSGQHAVPTRAAQLLEKRFCRAEGEGKRKRRPHELAVVVLDELDYLVTSRQSVLYNLFEWATRAASALIIVGISNTMDLPERLLPRVESRLNIRRVNFLPYSHKDIGKIIADRLGELDAFTANDGGIELCARKVHVAITNPRTSHRILGLSLACLLHCNYSLPDA